MTTNILAISGSLRAASFNTRLLRAAAALAPQGVTITIHDGVGDLPLYNQDLEAEPPAPVAALRAAIGAADGLLIASPEYNHSLSGVLKNAIDWASRPLGRSTLHGKCACVFVATGGKISGARSMADTARILRDLAVYVVGTPEVIVTEAHTRIVDGPDGVPTIADPMTVGLIGIQLRALQSAIESAVGTVTAQPLYDMLKMVMNPPKPTG